MFRLLFHATGRCALTLFFGISQNEQIKDHPCIVVANHNTHLDSLILFRMFPLKRVNRVKLIAARDYFSKGIGGFIGRTMFDLILLDRRSTKAATALEPLRQALRDGYSIIVYPEGTRGEPGVLQRFKTGHR